MKINKILLAILLGGLLLRTFWFKELFLYSHDQDLLGWIIRDITENGHLRLIGQETSNKGIFIGPLYYYSVIPFYLLFGMDPIGGILHSTIISFLTILSFYFVFKNIFSHKVGLISALIYAVSFLVVMTDREVVPTTPVMLWSVWFLYTLWLLLKGKQKQGLLLSGILLGLIWHLNLALTLLIPLLPLAFLLSKKYINVKHFLIGLVPLILLSLPLVAFEVRHNFQQTNSLIASLTTKKEIALVESTGLGKLDRVMQLVTKNTNRLFVGEYSSIPSNLVFFIMLFCFGYLVYKKKISPHLALLFVLWLVLFIAFFTFNPINVSEYYLNGMNVIWIGIVALFLADLLSSKAQPVGIFIIILFVAGSFYRFFSQPLNQSGYIQRKQVIQFIKQDAREHGFPCVAISYITRPGYELGYRYLIYQEGLHVNQPSSGSPVYSIVFPHSMVDKIDKSFGALGLILPEYGKYATEQVTISCGGENANLTDPLFGFTK